MTVEPLEGKRGKSWKVRYKDHNGKARAETYTAEVDAVGRDIQIKQAKSKREPIPARGRGDGGLTFTKFTREIWWPNYVEANKRAFKTEEQYAILFGHMAPIIGDDAIAFIDVPRAIELNAELVKAGVPDYTRARTLKLFRQIMGFAVKWGSAKENAGIIFSEHGALPPQGRKEDVKPLWPTETEAIRAAMQARKSSPFKLRDAVLVSVMAYAGLRPMEALALSWGGVRTDSIRVQRAKSKAGAFKPRTVPKLIRPLLDDLAEWREASPNTTAKALVFPAEGGGEWTRHGYGSWRKRVWDSCAPDDSTPYDCRHGYASLLAREGLDVAEGAKRMGHSVAMHVQHYTHVFEDRRDEPNEPMEAVVLKARAAVAHA
jgi:integrase